MNMEVELVTISNHSSTNNASINNNDNNHVNNNHNNTNAKDYEENEEDYYGQIRLKNKNKNPYGDYTSSKLDLNDENVDTIIELNNIHKTYLLGLEGVPALRGVNLIVKRGEFVCVFGTSGGGKTSLLNIIGTIDKPTKRRFKTC